MTEEEIFEALIKGAVVIMKDDGSEASISALDDLPPSVRECFRASQEHDYKHQNNCADCLESRAENSLFQAGICREEGDEAPALMCESDAAKDLAKAAQIRAKTPQGDLPFRDPGENLGSS